MELLDSFKFPAREQLVCVPLEKQSWRSFISIWLEIVFSLSPPLPTSPLPTSPLPTSPVLSPLSSLHLSPPLLLAIVLPLKTLLLFGPSPLKISLGTRLSLHSLLSYSLLSLRFKKATLFSNVLFMSHFSIRLPIFTPAR